MELGGENIAKWTGWTQLSHAVFTGDINAARELLEEGADVNAMSGPGVGRRYTVLKTASKLLRDGSGIVRPNLACNMVELLLSHGADVHSVDRSNLTLALHDAAWIGNADVVKLLLLYGADASERDGIYGNTPLMMSIYNTRAEMHTSRGGVKSFVSYNVHGFNQLDTQKMLIEAGGGVNVCNRDGSSPLHMATRLGNLDAMKLLIKHGAILDALDDEGRRPVDVAWLRCIIETPLNEFSWEAIYKGAWESIYRYIADEAARAHAEKLCLEQFRAFTMGQHDRLGANSLVSHLSTDILPKIWISLRKQHGLPVEKLDLN
jgi:hypothetical protein